MSIFNRNKDSEAGQSIGQTPAVSSDTKDNSFDKTSEAKVVKYGIEDAIKLMRNLPDDNIKVVVNVVKQTLESTDIQVSRIISDAEKKEANICDRVKKLDAEIAKYETSITDRKEQISLLKEDLRETSLVKEHLQLAENASQKESAAKPQDNDKNNPPVAETKSAMEAAKNTATAPPEVVAGKS